MSSNNFDLRIQNLELEISKILKNQEEMKKTLDLILMSCKGMDEHISFVDSVYESLKTPIDYISRRFNTLRINM